jgi:Tfp pilus assembly protein PilO
MALNISKVEITSAPKTVQTSFIEVGILLVVIGLFYWFILSPKLQSLALAKEEQKQLQEKQANSAKELKTLQELVVQLDNNKEYVDKLDQALPLDNKALRLQMLLEYLAGTSGLTVGDVTASAKGDAILGGDKALLAQPFGQKRTVQKMKASVYVTGSFDQLQAFLKKLESSGRVLDITTIDIGPAQEGLLGLRVSIDSYYFVP